MPLLDQHKASIATPDLGPDLALNGLTRDVAKLPISRVTAASSAFLGARVLVAEDGSAQTWRQRRTDFCWGCVTESARRESTR